tara:strand:+ start:60 stop:785 length:726 start_codon:yes stop_codon:yes gene_type:complete
MPTTADKFTALGAGNGFPLCLEKINMADMGDGQPWSFWITLGGNKKGGAVTEAGKGLSQAMKLFWNFNGLQYSLNDIYEGTIDIEELSFDILSWFDLDGNGFDYDENKFPMERVCVSGYQAISEFYIADAFIALIRMYDGDVNDEDNFVGYGMPDGFFYEGNHTYLVAGSYHYEDPGTDEAIYEYGSINGIHVVSALVYIGDPSASEITYGESSIKTTVSYASGYPAGEVLELYDFDFYTY